MHIKFLILASALLPATVAAQERGNPASSPQTSEQRVDGARAKFLEAMKPVCLDRAADLKAKRKPKRFAAFLLSLPAEIRPEVILACQSM